jgi:hypothetical protein
MLHFLDFSLFHHNTLFFELTTGKNISFCWFLMYACSAFEFKLDFFAPPLPLVVAHKPNLMVLIYFLFSGCTLIMILNNLAGFFFPNCHFC